MKEVDGILVAAGELKEPLMVLRQLALAFDSSDPANLELQSEMIGVSERALRQVNDLAKIRRLEDGLFEMEPVAVRAVCDEVISELKTLFGVSQKKFSVKYLNRSRIVMANADLLKSVIYNFLTNAEHYEDEGNQLELKILERRGNIRITVRDFGPALPTKTWREIKKGWINEPSSIAMRPGSSGLGLYIASKFAKYMNGKVGATRHQDGASFFVEFKASKQASLWDSIL